MIKNNNKDINKDNTLEKYYDIAKVEAECLAHWNDKGYFDHDYVKDKPYFTIVIPPPNVTGVLHIGHAFNNVFQDVYCRMARMEGKSVLWQPGTDHAGISTQIIIEKQLLEKGIKREDLDRSQVLAEIYKWKDESGNKILHQLAKLGASCDFKRARFTMDSGNIEAVRFAFIKLFNDGLIYQDERLVNWDPIMATALSDLEVINEESNSTLYHIFYPFADSEESEQEGIIVATTRPETMFGDVAVAVHPKDSRYQKYIGKKLILPLSNREIPIIADENVSMEKGSGALKITPAHDFNDFEIGRKHNLEAINIFDSKALLNENVPSAYQSLSREKAREKVIKELKNIDLLKGSSSTINFIPKSDRSQAIIEPMLTKQWYLDAKKLSYKAIDEVKNKNSEIIPENWEKIYFQWLENIKPWCISRQIWWGHEIPIWYGPDEKAFAANDENEAYDIAKKYYAKKNIATNFKLRKEEDVLDTWFSSALWPFATLGWPKESQLLENRYPTNLLITAFDIIFFWVARMMMLGIYLTKKIPFRKVIVHALVRDQYGKKMSKSKGNVVDPLTLIDNYGADSLRFALAYEAAPGRNISLSIDNIKGMRNFLTKIYNCYRLIIHYKAEYDPNFHDGLITSGEHQWIYQKIDKASDDITEALANGRLMDAAHCLYDLFWQNFCDRYLELIKIHLISADEQSSKENHKALVFLFIKFLQLAHPFIPFITEHLFKKLTAKDTITYEKFSAIKSSNALNTDKKIIAEIDHILDLVHNIRSLKSKFNLSNAFKIKLTKYDGKFIEQELAKSRLLKLANADLQTEIIENNSNFQFQCQGLRYSIELGKEIDLEKEIAKQELLLKQYELQLEKVKQRLNNENFISKALEHIIEEHKQKCLELEELMKATRIIINSLKNIV